jgi:hypothetical protein
LFSRAIGYIEDRPEWKGRRLLQIFPYGLNFRNDNQFTHPFDFVAIVDSIQERVIAIEDLPVHHQFAPRNRNQGVTVPRAPANYDSALLANTSVPASPGRVVRPGQPARGPGQGRVPSQSQSTPARNSGQGRVPSQSQPTPPRNSGQGRAPSQSQHIPARNSGQGRVPSQSQPTPVRNSGQGRVPSQSQPAPARNWRFKRQRQSVRNGGLRATGNLVEWQNFRIRIGL